MALIRNLHAYCLLEKGTFHSLQILWWQQRLCGRCHVGTKRHSRPTYPHVFIPRLGEGVAPDLGYQGREHLDLPESQCERVSVLFLF